ncbi:MAG: acyl-CoA dehydrogenase family protein [Kibdelosporangium sp.]
MPTSASFAAELFLGRCRTDLLRMPPGDPRRLEDDEEHFLARLRTFCAEQVDSGLIEREDRIPDHVIEGLKDIGAFCVRIPQEYGGLGLSDVCYHRALMIVSTVHSALSELLAAHQAIGLIQPLRLAGTDAQKKEFLPRCVREISAFALTEADIGNDPFRLRTTAVRNREAGTYTLDGVKLWTTNGVIADLIVVMADIPTSDHGEGGMTAFIVEAGSPGVTVEHRSSFAGLRGLENGVIRLSEVVVPERNRIGDEGAGLDIALAAQDTGRLSLPAVCAAASKWSLKIARQWAGARIQWDRPIGEHDAVAGKLAFVAATAFALEAIVEVSARQADAQIEAELAKLFASEQAWLVADELMQLRGGRGYETADSAVARGERGVPVEQVLRDLRIGRIFDGSSEVLRVFLAQSIIDRARSADGSATTVSSATGPLADHWSFVAEAAGRLADGFAQAAAWHESELADHQRHLGRLVDIGAELYAMSASCVYATALPDLGGTPIELAGAFCSQARHRIAELFSQLSNNTDGPDRQVSRRVLASRYEWLEEGVPDPSVEGPWIAEPKRGPNVRRAVPARP